MLRPHRVLCEPEITDERLSHEVDVHVAVPDLAPRAANGGHNGLPDTLAAVERVFDVDELLGSRLGAADVVSYYRQSLLLYLLVINRGGAVHFALDGSDFSAHARIISRHLRPIGPSRVLELASGLGYNAVRLGRSLGAASVTGVDLTRRHVRLARLRARRLASVRFEHGDFHRLRFGPRSFDGVCAVEGFCYARNLRRALGEVARVLRHGGRFVMVDGFLRRPLAMLSHNELTAVRLIDSAFAVHRTWTLDDLVATGEPLGLRLVANEVLDERVLPNVDRTAGIARYCLDRPMRARAFRRLLPPKLMPNAIAAVLLPHVVRSGAYGYNTIVLERSR